MNVLRYIRLVLWSFFGIRRQANANEEIGSVRPIGLVVTAVVLALAFAVFLIFVAMFAVRTLSP